MKPIFIIAGHKKAGKTRFLQKLITLLQQDGFQLKGFIAPHNEQTDSYSIRNLQSNEIKLLMKRTGRPHQKSEHFQVMKEGLNAGREWLNETNNTKPFIAVIDEIGSYELAGEIWCTAFTKLTQSDEPLVFTTKIKFLPAVLNKWKIYPAAVFYPQDFTNPEKISTQIKNTIRLYKENSF